MANIKATWRIRVDEKTKAPSIYVEYESEDPPGSHERIHAALAAKAEELLREYFGPNALLEHTRFECVPKERKADPRREDPVPIPQPNSGVSQ